MITVRSQALVVLCHKKKNKNKTDYSLTWLHDSDYPTTSHDQVFHKGFALASSSTIVHDPISSEYSDTSDGHIQIPHIMVNGYSFSVLRETMCSTFPQATVTMAASQLGWRGRYLGKTVQGMWSIVEASLHISVLEMTVVLLVFQILQDSLPHRCDCDPDRQHIGHLVKTSGTCSYPLCCEAMIVW